MTQIFDIAIHGLIYYHVCQHVLSSVILYYEFSLADIFMSRSDFYKMNMDSVHNTCQNPELLESTTKNRIYYCSELEQCGTLCSYLFS